MRNIYSLLFSLFFLATGSFAQRNCGTMDHLHHLEEQDPNLRERMEKIENHTRFLIEQNADNVMRSSTVIQIPVVVHVLYRVASENISDAQILTQIQVLNEDFRRLNADASQTLSQFQGVAADAEIEFCLASIAPNGTSTNGITRTSTTKTTFGTNNSVKFNAQGGKDAWTTSQYLNIWVCNIGGGILGYAQFPGGAASTDGVVCDYRYFGTTGTATAPFNKGRTATHEVGHWLNLRHIWGDGNCSVDDFVADTPVSSSPNYACPLSTVKCSSLDMVQNYMDYTDDACMNIYTAGQKVRMRALFAAGGSRAGLLTSTGCGASQPSCSDGIQNGTETGVDCGGNCSPCQPVSGCLTYCTSRGNSTADEFIQSVTLGGYTNSSGNNGGYASFNTSATYQPGQSYNFTLVPGWTGTVYAEYFRIWADWNKDGDFSDSGEMAFTQSAATTQTSVTGSFTVPANAVLGNTTIRVQMKYNAAPANCETFSWGEVEDYCVEILPAVAVCNVPVGLNATAVAAASATLNWQAVSGATSYTVRAREIGQTTWSSGTTTATSLNYTGLTSCTNYEFQVSTTCGGQSSAYSGSSAFSTIGCVTQICNQPGSLAASSITASQALLSWGAVTGAASYNARARAFGTTTWSTGNVIGTSINFTGLSACTGYEFQVETVCTNGLSSGYTASGNFITPGCASCAVPTVAYVDNITTTSARFNWSSMPGATNYTLRYRRTGTTAWTTTNSTATSITRTGLLCGSTYQYQIRSRCNNAWTGYSATRNFSTSGCNREMEEQAFTAVDEKLDFSLYPNPASDITFIVLPPARDEANVTMRIYDLSGRMVFSKNIIGFTDSVPIEINTAELSGGFYLVQVSIGNRVSAKRLIISK